jgi:hypothetical protein
LSELEELIERVPRASDRALAARSAALLAPDDEAAPLFERALELHHDETPFEAARTHLLSASACAGWANDGRRGWS